MRRHLLIAILPAALLIAGAGYSADQAATGPADQGKIAGQEYMAAMKTMQQAMMRAQDANPDRAFALQMIAHHEGAIAMSKIELQYGGAPELKRMAEQMIAAQTKEVGELQSWLDHHGGRAPKF